jgi:hypothetical protein
VTDLVLSVISTDSLATLLATKTRHWRTSITIPSVMTKFRRASDLDIFNQQNTLDLTPSFDLSIFQLGALLAFRSAA